MKVMRPSICSSLSWPLNVGITALKPVLTLAFGSRIDSRT